MILIKVYKTKNKIKSKHCVLPDGYRAQTNQEILEGIREFPNEDFKFVDVNNNSKDITYDCLINILQNQELSSTKKINLKSVICGGGFIDYITKLEGKE